jgi:hypothetical protein
LLAGDFRSNQKQAQAGAIGAASRFLGHQTHIVDGGSTEALTQSVEQKQRHQQ